MFSSATGGVIFLKFFFLGVLFGLAFEICKIFKRVFKNNIYIQNTIYFVYFSILGLFFCSYNLSLCDGVFYVHTVIATILGIIIEQISIGFFFTKFYSLVYNITIKLSNKIKSTKIGTKILK